MATLFSALTSKIFGGLSVALLIALGLLWSTHLHDQHTTDDLRRKLATKDAQLAVSNVSIATLEQKLAEYVGAGKAAKVAQLAAVQSQAKDNAALQAQADAIRAEVAGIKPGAKCATPKSVVDAKGL